ncbi:MAG: lysylphosphatidylglycerol synthase transmembrane domain-containing protein [Candidatus Scalindua sp.]
MLTSRSSSSRFVAALRKWGVRSIGLFAFAFLITRIDINQVITGVIQANPVLVFVAFSLTFPFFAIKSWRWQSLLNSLGLFISYPKVYLLYMIGLFAGLLTPGQVGEMVKVYYIKRSGGSIWMSGLSIVLDRLLDLGLLVVLTIPVFWVFDDIVTINLSTRVLVVLAAITALFFIFKDVRKRVIYFINFCYSWIIQKIKKKYNIESMGNLNILKRIPYSSVITLTALAYAINYLRFYLLLAALQVQIPLLHLIVGLALVWLVGTLPISVAGIGTRDLALITVFSHLGIRSELAISFSFLILGLYLFQMIVGFLFWIIKGDKLDLDVNMNVRKSKPFLIWPQVKEGFLVIWIIVVTFAFFAQFLPYFDTAFNLVKNTLGF